MKKNPVLDRHGSNQGKSLTFGLRESILCIIVHCCVIVLDDF